MAKILILDDDTSIRAVLTRILEFEKYDIVEAESAERAEQCLNNTHCDLILCDIELPGESGISFAKRILHNSPDIAVVMVSYINDAEVAKDLINAGVYGYITKPLDRNQVIIQVSNALNRLELEIINRQYSHGLEDEVNRQTSELKQTISSLESTQANLTKSELTLRAITSNAKDAIIMMNSEGIITFWNEAATSIFGYLHEEALGQDLYKLLAENNNYSGHLRRLSKFKKTGEGSAVGKRIELSAKRKSGDLIEVEMSLSAVKLDNEWYAIGIIRDITTRKKAELALKTSEEKYRDLVEKAGLAIVVDDQMGNIQYFNDNYCKIFGYSRQEMEKLDRKSVIHPDDLSMVSEYHEKRLQGKKVPSSYQCRCIRKNGSIMHVEVDISKLSKNGDSYGTIIYLRDISARIKEQNIRNIVYNINTAKYHSESIDQFFMAVRKELGKIINTQNFFIGLYDHDSGMLTLPYMKDDNDQFERVPIKNTISSYVIRDKKTLFLKGDQISGFIKEKGIESVGTLAQCWLGVPLLMNNKAIGLMVVQNYENPNAFSTVDKNLLELTASQIALTTQKMQIEKELKVLSRAIEQSPLSIVVTDSKGSIEYVNPFFCEITGYSYAEAIGQNPRVLKSEKTDPEQYKKLWNTISEGRVWKGVFQNKKKDGSFFWEDAVISPVLDENNKITHYIALKRDITLQKKMETALFQEKHMLESIMNNLTDNVYFKDKQSRMIRVNKAMADYFGLDNPDDILGKTDADFFAEDHAKKALSDEKQILKQGKEMRSEEKEVWPDGSETWVSTVKAPLHDQEGNIIGTFGISRDITSVKNNERYLRENEAFLGSLLDAIPIPVFYKNKQGMYTGCNATFETFFGTTKENMIGKTVFDFNPEKLANIYHEKDQELLANEGTQIYESEIKDARGKIHHVIFHKAVFYDSQRNLNGLIGTILDISDRKMAEEALKDSEERLKSILESVPTGIAILNKKNQTIEYANRTALRMMKRKKNEVFGKPCTQIMCASDDGSCSFDKSNEEEVSFDCVIKTKTGEELPVLKNIVKINIDGDSKLIESFIDTKKLKETELALAQAQKLESIGQLAAGIAHEINTPAQYVGDNLHFLKDSFNDLYKVLEVYKKLDEVEVSESQVSDILRESSEISKQADLEFLLEEVPLAIDQTLEGIEKVSKIVRAMKEFSHPGGSDKTQIDLNRAIENTLTVSRNEWKYMANVITNFDPALTSVPCFPDALNQVLLNMIINATHAIEEKFGKGELRGIISISTEKNEQDAKISVGYNGIGIPEKNMKHIFNLFFTTKKVGKGTGQGLAIAHDVIVNKHRGKIDVESKEGEGTTFIIKLPLTN